ncbi:MAG: putative immunity protein [Verrucomicrobiota bacterium]
MLSKPHRASPVMRAATQPKARQAARHFDKQNQRSLALWAAGCAGHVLPFFEKKHPRDDRPRKAIEAGRAWAQGKIKCGEARAAAVAAHAAARDADEGAARAAARAAGHAAGTAHMAGHARHAAAYAVKAAAAAGIASAKERGWQRRRLPARHHTAAVSISGVR